MDSTDFHLSWPYKNNIPYASHDNTHNASFKPVPAQKFEHFSKTEAYWFLEKDAA